MGLFAQGAYAQVKVGDNPTTINSNSVLELEATNKGLLLPRVALSATTNASPLSAHVAGMIVYNTATAGTLPNDVVPGYYYNDGTKWQLIAFSDLADVDNDGGPVIDNTLTAPPTSGDDGDVYIVPSSATGDWAGQTNNIAELSGVNSSGSLVWSFSTPVSGEKRVITEGANAGNTYQFNGTTWVLTSTRPPTSPFWRLGGNYTNTRNNRVGTISNNSFRLMSRGRDRVIIHSNGNVSIGRTTAPSKLTVQGGAMFQGGSASNLQGLHLSWNASALFNGISAQGYSGFVNHRGTGPGGFTWAQTNNASTYLQLMRLNPNGLLIGGGLQDYPNERLDVDGNVRFSGALMPNGISGSSGQVLISGGSNNPPTWGSFTNLYTSNGSLTGDRIVTQGTNTIAFTSSATTGTSHFSVDGTTLNVDAVNNRVGIGTASAVSRLTVSGNIMLNGSGSANVQGSYFVWNDGNLGGSGRSGFLNHRGLGSGGFVFSGTADNTNFQEYMRIENNGNVGIGTTSPSQRLTVANGTSTGTYTTSGWVHSSDARLKTNIIKVENALGLVNQLNGVYYNWNNNIESGRQLGFLAQDVQKVVPEVVMGVEGDVTKGETLSMAYQNLVPILVEAIKEQQKQIDELKAKLELLEKK